MLKSLLIKNYILIENQSIDFHTGFSVLTGETGAGKSIILGALGLILGDRADRDIVLKDQTKCIVEAQFDISNLDLKDFFVLHDIDYDDICILRREINRFGKSRAFINDTPVGLQSLKNFGEQVMDIHSQNQKIQLNNAQYRMSIVDSYAAHSNLLIKFKSKFKSYQKNMLMLNDLKQERIKNNNEQDYNQFLFDELDALSLQKGEQAELEGELKLLSHSEEIKSVIFQLSELLLTSDQNIVSQIERRQNDVEKLSEYHEGIRVLSERLKSAFIELKDIGEEFIRIDNSIHVDKNRLDDLENRLNRIYALLKKHGKTQDFELLQIKDELSNSILHLDDLSNEIEKLESKNEKELFELNDMAVQLSLNRKKAVKNIEKFVLELLKELGLQNASFKINLEEQEKLTLYGKDGVSFLFSANKGTDAAKLSKVASGGELSRLMLALKYTMSLKQSIPSIVFDEIDSGVSGEIADKLGKLMEKLGHQIQVIAITHLPQIAARAKTHYLVYKENDSIFARSKIKKLTSAHRLQEIAAMLSGSKIEKSAIKHAEKLLKQN
jgi:DNA repair protein RecN (Recombination protein N)